jgi:hypothetical protein
VTSPSGPTDRISFSIGAEDDGATRTLARVADGMDDVSRLSAQLRKARTAEANAAGQVRVAEARLNDLRSTGRAKAGQLAAAEESLAKAQRGLTSAQEIAADFTGKLSRARAAAASQTAKVGRTLGSEMVGEAAEEADRRGRKAFLTVGRSMGGGIRAGIVQPLTGLSEVVGGVIAGAGLASFVKSAVLNASDLNETISKTKVIFDRSADSVIDWAQDSVRSMGLTRQQALSAAAGFGDMFLQLGLAGDQATGMSKEMVQLAADLASFNNADITEVLESQAAAFRGEYDSIQKYIPNINAARVEQEAMAESGKKTSAELTAQDKVLATQAILLQDSARASGDFARTSSGTANQMRILQANFQEFLGSLGQEFLPLVNKGVSVLNDFMGPLGQAVKFAGDLPPGIYAGAAALGVFVVTAKVATAITGKLGDAFNGLVEAGGGYESTGRRLADTGERLSTALRGALFSINPLSVVLAAGAAAVGAYAQKKYEAKQRVEEFTRSIEADSGALGRNTRQLIAQRLEQEGALKAAQLFGLDLVDVTEAVLGNEAALARVNGRLSAYAASQQQAASAGDTVNASAKESDEAYRTLQESIGGANTELNKAVQSQVRQAAAAGTAGAATQTSTAKVKEQGTTAADTAAKVNSLVTEMFSLAAANGDVASADIAFRNSLAQLTQSVKDNGTSIGLNTQKGRDNRSAVIASVEAAQRYASAVGTQTGSQDKARKAFLDSIPAIREQARRLGLNKTEVDKLIGSIAKLKPKTVPVQAVVSVVDAISARAVTPNRTGRNSTTNQGGLAFGGWVPGHSPTDRADNIPALIAGTRPLNLTGREFVIQRPTAVRIERQAPGFLDALNAGALDIGGDTAAMRVGNGAPLGLARGGSVPAVKQFIRAQDPKPYVWGAAGPGGFDCSGLVGAAYGQLTGRGGGSGQRYFTTDTVGSVGDLRPGLGAFSIGVTPGRGHMAGQLGGLKFEARSTASGILVGSAAASPKSFARQFYLPSLGGAFGVDELTSRQKGQIFNLIRPQIAADLMDRVNVGRYDVGGELPPGLTLALNGTGRGERIRTGAQEDALLQALLRVERAIREMPAARVDGRVIKREYDNQSTRSNGW